MVRCADIKKWLKCNTEIIDKNKIINELCLKNKKVSLYIVQKKRKVKEDIKKEIPNARLRKKVIPLFKNLQVPFLKIIPQGYNNGENEK